MTPDLVLTALEIRDLLDAERKALVEGRAVAPRHDFLVVEEALDKLKSKLDQLARRAEKLGLPAVKYEVGDFLDEKVSRGEGRHQYVRRYALHLEGASPKLAGWVFAATLEHLDGGENIVRSTAEVEVPVAYRTAPSRCDHCGTTRRRNDTYVLYHSETQTYKQVGKNCIRDFLGHVDAERLARIAEFLFSALEAAEGSESSGGGYARSRYGVDEVLTLSAATVEQHGWVSKGKAREQAERGGAGISTADIVGRNLWENPAKLREYGFLVEPTDKHAALATIARVWAKNLSDAEVERSDYLYNVRTIAKCEAIESRLLGYACSIIAAYNRFIEGERERAEERKAASASQHVGAVGERLVLTVRVLFLKHFESDYGTKHLHTFVDDKTGNRFKWWSTSACYNVDEVVTIKGTVKAHEEYKEVKYTVLSRCAEYTPPAPKVKKPRAKKAKAAPAEQAELPLDEEKDAKAWLSGAHGDRTGIAS